MTSEDPTPQRDQQAVQRFIERFASVLVEAGVPRMPARVFVALLATDSGRLTAAELADVLQVSPAAISGAVRYLSQVNLVSRQREPGSRRDHYHVYDDAWYEAVVRRERMMDRWNAVMREGVDTLGRDTPAGTRLAESVAFFEFVQEELPDMLERWRKRKAELRDDPSAGDSPTRG
ncbi:GbsR/MarR family transcriptional regulator [Gandjariella thermophila]|uniref:GbsR/MarR family transcriptional regulator n=2 Tax=Gandjariella thermophila TaxID=1931992 RepID=UPI001CEF6DE2|nr:MarR family transcriptional regulator [Gandjariella thermophila]